MSHYNNITFVYEDNLHNCDLQENGHSRLYLPRRENESNEMLQYLLRPSVEHTTVKYISELADNEKYIYYISPVIIAPGIAGDLSPAERAGPYLVIKCEKLFMLNRFFLYAGQAVEGFIELSVKPLYFLIFFPEILRKQPQRKRQEGR